MVELVPRKMKQIRFMQNKSRAQVGRETGMQGGMVGWIEEGRFIPYESQLNKLAEALGVDDPETLLEPLEVQHV